MSRMSDLDALVQSMIHDAQTMQSTYCWRRVFGYPNTGEILAVQDTNTAVILANGCELKAVPLGEIRFGSTVGTIERLGDDVLVVDGRGLRERLWSLAEIASVFSFAVWDHPNTEH